MQHKIVTLAGQAAWNCKNYPELSYERHGLTNHWKAENWYFLSMAENYYFSHSFFIRISEILFTNFYFSISNIRPHTHCEASSYFDMHCGDKNDWTCTQKFKSGEQRLVSDICLTQPAKKLKNYYGLVRQKSLSVREKCGLGVFENRVLEEDIWA